MDTTQYIEYNLGCQGHTDMKKNVLLLYSKKYLSRKLTLVKIYLRLLSDQYNLGPRPKPCS